MLCRNSSTIFPDISIMSSISKNLKIQNFRLYRFCVGELCTKCIVNDPLISMLKILDLIIKGACSDPQLHLSTFFFKNTEILVPEVESWWNFMSKVSIVKEKLAKNPAWKLENVASTIYKTVIWTLFSQIACKWNTCARFCLFCFYHICQFKGNSFSKDFRPGTLNKWQFCPNEHSLETVLQDFWSFYQFGTKSVK